MEDLYTRFDREYSEAVVEARKLFKYLSESFFGADDDLKRIRDVYRVFLDMKSYFTSKNDSITRRSERSYREDYRDKDAFNNLINDQIQPFKEMFEFLIVLYEENR